jgi:hypothetical protein
VRGLIQADGTWLARSIELSAQEAGAFELNGEIESIDPWRVAGLEFETREWTEIEPGLSIGDLVHVEGQILPDGTWVAAEIDQLDPDFDSRIVLIGTVISIDPWVVAGFPLTIGVDTVIVGNITVGMLVRVEVYLLANGEWQVVRIEPASGLVWAPGCTNVTATVVTLNGNQLQLQGWPLLTLDEGVMVEGEILPNSIIQIQVCFTAEVEIHITTIIVIYQPEQELPPPTEGGKVLVCHKPDKKGGHTLSISPSAVPAHLGHGDRLGACGK